MELAHKVRILLQKQLTEWEQASKNYNDLKKIRTKDIILKGGSTIRVQFNPARIHSSAAKVDKKTISERPCFLCKKNRPAEQESITYNEKYSILVNPFPIFPEHLTIVYNEHVEQLIMPHFEQMLILAKELEDFTIFYNGPKSGASAPDHFHFQAGIKGFLPIEKDYNNKKYTVLQSESEVVQLYTWVNYHRHIITLDSNSLEETVKVFKHLHHKLKDILQPEEPEPMLNILAYHENGRYIVHVFPRILHRPDCYFAEGDAKILLSPASVDLGGVFVTPREEDFDKITAEDIEDILEQVCLESKASNKIINSIIRNYK